jgi:hypothetical protein
MKPKPSMTCAEFSGLLNLEDLDARPDPELMRDHFRHCAECASRFPELRLIYRDALAAPADLSASRPSPASLSRGHRGRWIAAGIACLLAGGLLLIDPSRSAEKEAAEPSGATPAARVAAQSETVPPARPDRALPIELRSEAFRIQHIPSGSGMIRTRYHEGTWRAPLPSVLRQQQES